MTMKQGHALKFHHNQRSQPSISLLNVMTESRGYDDKTTSNAWHMGDNCMDSPSPLVIRITTPTQTERVQLKSLQDIWFNITCMICQIVTYSRCSSNNSQ